MKSILLAALLTATSANAGNAADYLTPPVALDPTSELLVSIVNTCPTAATYSIAVRNVINGKTLRSKHGTLAVKHGTMLPFSWGMPQLVYQKITFECQETEQARPLIAFTVRDLQTKVPRFLGGDELLD